MIEQKIVTSHAKLNSPIVKHAVESKMNRITNLSIAFAQFQTISRSELDTLELETVPLKVMEGDQCT